MLFNIKLLIHEIKNYKEILIIGDGIRAQALKKFLESIGLSVKELLNFEEVDNIPSGFLNNLKLEESIFLYEKDYIPEPNPIYFMGKHIVIEKDFKKTKELLRKEEHIIFLEIDNSIMTLLQRQLTPRKPSEFCFEVNISDHCNLNCRMCTHFSPISKKEFYNLEQYKKDITRLGVLFDHCLEHIILMGGEPLLNENLDEYIKATRINFPKCNITVHSNGILLQKAESLSFGNLWEICKKYDIGVNYTIYPLKIDYVKIEETAKKYGVRTFGFVEASNINITRDKMLSREPLSLESFADPEDYIICYRLNMCTNLRNGKIYSCPTTAYINKVNEKYGVEFKISDYDYIDIYKAKNSEEICSFVSHKIPFCRYCKQTVNAYDIPWQRSKKEINEWICSDQEVDFCSALDKLKKSQISKSLFVFGESHLSTSFVIYNGLIINGFLDNDKCKQGKIIFGVKVYPVDYILRNPSNYVLIVSNHFYQMKNQLLGLNFPEDRIIDGRLLFKTNKLELF